MNTPRETVRVDLGTRSYDILIGNGLLAEAGEVIAPILGDGRVVVVTDEKVAAHHLDTLTDSLSEAGIDGSALTLPAGEATKSYAMLEQVLEALLEEGLGRKDMLVALGGGVIGDLTGFAASVYKRGIDFIQIPTTLLAQVDSSVGGKTGINSPHGKNLVGAFHQPRLVLADTDVLATLPQRELGAGYAEVVKYGLIDDAHFFAWLEQNGSELLNGDAGLMTHAIKTSCEAKARIVAQDEREGGVRALLNLGHTFGHALEAETGFSDRLLHGEGVALGMALAFRLSVRRGEASAEDLQRVEAHLKASGLPARLSDIPQGPLDRQALIGHMAQDKKAEGSTIVFILSRGIGGAYIARDVDMEDVAAILEEAAE